MGTGLGPVGGPTSLHAWIAMYSAKIFLALAAILDCDLTFLKSSHASQNSRFSSLNSVRRKAWNTANPSVRKTRPWVRGRTSPSCPQHPQIPLPGLLGADAREFTKSACSREPAALGCSHPCQGGPTLAIASLWALARSVPICASVSSSVNEGDQPVP